MQGFVTFSGGDHSRSKFFPPNKQLPPCFSMSVFTIAYHENLRGPPPMPSTPPIKGNQWFFRPNISTSWEAHSHIYASASMLRSAVSFCCASLMSQQNLDQKKANGMGPVGSFLERISFQVDAIKQMYDVCI